MNCPQCGTAFPHPTAGQGTRLYCLYCGTRLFAWLGDPFGTSEAAPVVRAGGGSNVVVIVVAVIALLLLFTCLCMPMLANLS